MAQYYTNFGEYTVNTAPSDWTATGSYPLFAPRIKPSSWGASGQHLHLFYPTFFRFTYLWNVIDSDPNRANAEVYARFKPLSYQSLTLAARGVGNVYVGNTGDVVSGGFTATNSLWFLEIFNGAPQTNESTEDVYPPVNKISHLKFRVNGTNAFVKSWQEGTPEPDWETTATITSVTGVGGVGFMPTYYEDVEIDYFSVGTGGDSAPMPAATRPDYKSKFVSIFTTLQDPPSIFPTDWRRRAPITIQASKVNASLIDFPLLLTKDTLPAEMFDADGLYSAQNGGGDLRFTTDAAGANQIPCEIVSFVTDNNPAVGSAQIWVKVPNVSNTVDTTIYVWYNTAQVESQPIVTDTYGRNAVWADYIAVWHYADDPSGPQTDSTGNGHTATPTLAHTTEVGPNSNMTALIHNDRYLTVPNSAEFSSQTLSISGWARPVGTYSAGGIGSIIAKWDSTDNEYRLVLFKDNFPGILNDNLGGEYGFETNNGVKFDTSLYQVYENDLTWRYVVATYENTNAYLFADSFKNQEIGTGNIITKNVGIGLGGQPDGLNIWKGATTELRISTNVISGHVVNAEYANQSSPATFAIPGTPESTSGIIIITNVTDGIGRTFTVGQTGIITTGSGFGSAPV